MSGAGGEHAAAREALAAALADALVGARIDGAFVTPDTGLVVLSAFAAGAKRWVGFGIGPRVAGVGYLPRAPRARAGAAHPLVAALRAHVVDHRVRSVTLDDEGVVWIAVGGGGAVARLAVAPGRRGAARVLDATGRAVVRFPRAPGEAANAGEGAALASEPTALAPPDELAARGAAMLAASERYVVEQARAALSRVVRARAQTLSRRAEAVRGDLARLREVDQLQKIGRLLLAQGDRVPRGAARAALEDWESDEGGTLEVALDPARPARAQAETYFARARRYQRGAVVMERRLAEAEASAAALTALRGEITAVDTAGAPDAALGALDALAARARQLGVSEARPVADATRGGTSAKSAAAREGGRRPYTLYRGWNARPILVGRGGRDNDALTTRHARPHDLWLHARSVTGAHVIVPLEKGQSCPPELLVDAATLALHHSDARGEQTFEVTYVERRHVRKPRGSAPGAVTFDHEKVLVVRLEPARLERLLAAREDG